MNQRAALSHSMVSCQCKRENALKSSYVDFFPMHMTINFFAGKPHKKEDMRKTIHNKNIYSVSLE